MNKTTRNIAMTLPVLIAGAAGGYWLGSMSGMDHGTMNQESMDMAASSTGSGPCPGGTEPDYWVAPMDAQFRRDAPGKSPMGMALVPECGSAGASDVSVSPAMLQTLGVQTAVARRARLQPVVRTVGTVTIDESTVTMIHTRAEGWLESVSASARGDTVTVGTPLYQLFAPKLVAAERDYLAARGNRLLRSAARERLLALGYTDAQVQALARAGRASETLTVSAPQSGVLTMLGAREGQYVQPGTHLMTLADLSTVWITVQVPERQAHGVQVGQAATMMVEAYPAETWAATVDYVYPELNMRTRSVELRLAVNNPDGRLQPGMFAAAVIDTAATDMATVVPASAVIRTGGSGPLASRVVKAVGAGEFDVVPVRTGLRVGDDIQITEGLEPGDEIVVAGQFLLDSEANVSAEAMRVSHQQDAPTERSGKRGRATGSVVSVNAEAGKLVLDHGPFQPEGDTGLSMPGMTMGFELDSGVSLAGIQAGDRVSVVVENPSRGVYRIVEILPASAMSGGMKSMSDAGHDAMGHVAMDRDARDNMAHQSMDHSAMQHGSMDDSDQQGMTHGTVAVVNPDTGLLVLDHAPIESLQMDAMTMGFAVAGDVDLSGLTAGDTVMFTAEHAKSGPNAGKFQVTAIHKTAAPKP